MLNIIALIVSCFYLMIGSLNADSCPTYATMTGFDPTKASGVWYQIATDPESVSPTTSCLKITWTNNKNGTVQIDNSVLGLDGNEMKGSQLYTTDDKTSLYLNMPIVDQSLFSTTIRQEKVKLAILYTDYTNIAASFACYENTENNVQKANRGFSIYVRHRNFDSLSQFGAALQALNKFGVDLDDIRLENNSPSCKN